MVCAASLMVLSMQVSAPGWSVLCVGLASLSSDLTLPGAWGVCMDVGGKHTGALSATMNMCGNVGGAIAPMIVPLILAATDNNWNRNIVCFALAYCLAGLCWWFVDCTQQLDEDPANVNVTRL